MKENLKKQWIIRTIIITLPAYFIVSILFDIIMSRELDFLGAIIKAIVFSVVFSLIMERIQRK